MFILESFYLKKSTFLLLFLKKKKKKGKSDNLSDSPFLMQVVWQHWMVGALLDECFPMHHSLHHALLPPQTEAKWQL